MSQSLNLSMIRPFGPAIGRLAFPAAIMETVNGFVDDLAEKEATSPDLDQGPKLVGQVTQEIRLPEDLVEAHIAQYLAAACREMVLQQTRRQITQFRIIDVWVVRQFDGEYNPVHTHSGHISGVGYLKLPSSFGPSRQSNKPNNQNGKLTFHYGMRHFLSNGHFVITPEVGDFYLFPNHLYHSVNPFYGEGERRSMSFNAFVDDDIYNVY